MTHAVAVFRSSVTDLHKAHDELAAEVAERRRAVERLEHTQRDLVQAGKMAALGQMSAAISHEINQPLAAMQHRLHNLRRAHPEAADAAGRLESLVQRITGTITRLRRIARRANYQMGRVALLEPMNAVLDLLDHRLKATETVLDGLTALEDHTVEGDEILIEQVLLNVLGNAIDAIEETGLPGLIRLAVVADAGRVELIISDSGPGLRGRSGADLVDPFFTTKDVGRGLGLGLSIAFNVMQDMGGFLDIAEDPAGGARLRLRFRAWTEATEQHG
jgi:two-component system C4-dicarboxylate transport sensor histidine kinase DctB